MYSSWLVGWMVCRMVGWSVCFGQIVGGSKLWEVPRSPVCLLIFIYSKYTWNLKKLSILSILDSCTLRTQKRQKLEKKVIPSFFCICLYDLTLRDGWSVYCAPAIVFSCFGIWDFNLGTSGAKFGILNHNYVIWVLGLRRPAHHMHLVTATFKLICMYQLCQC